MIIEFDNVKYDRLKKCFNNVLLDFDELHAHKIILRRTGIKKTTMRAQPLMNLNFFRRHCRDYRIDMSYDCKINKDVKIEELPKEVLEGWFAHELGHIMDYTTRNALNMIWLGITYLISRRHKGEVEKRADVFAIHKGYANQLIASKRYILRHAKVSERYKRQIQRYYYSPAEIEQLVLKQDLSNAG